MSDLREVPYEELKRATNPLHINMCTFDTDRIIEAYPTIIVDQMVSEFNQQTNEYIAKQCMRLDIDKDVLLKQTEELNRLNNDTQKLCEKAYQQGRADKQEEILKILNGIDTQVEQLVRDILVEDKGAEE